MLYLCCTIIDFYVRFLFQVPFKILVVVGLRSMHYLCCWFVVFFFLCSIV